jgi:hypothetical protein
MSRGFTAESSQRPQITGMLLQAQDQRAVRYRATIWVRIRVNQDEKL